jgi:Protein of unknown function (DUF3349)
MVEFRQSRDIGAATFKCMALSDRLSKIVAFLRAGYPSGMPATGYVPLAALSPRRVADDEIAVITSELVASRRWPMSAPT